MDAVNAGQRKKIRNAVWKELAEHSRRKQR
jgi:hypothetical protein